MLDPGTNSDDSLHKGDLKIEVRVPPDPRKASRPVLAIYGFPRSLELLLRKDSDLRSKIWTANLAAYRARRKSGILIIPDSFCLARATVCS